VWFRGIANSDLFVANPQRMVDALVSRLGFVAPDVGLPMQGLQDDGFYRLPDYGAQVAFTRLSPWTTASLEVIAMSPLSQAEKERAGGTPLNSLFGVLPAIALWEGNRPVKCHQVNTILPDEDLLALVRHWDRIGLPYLLTEPNEIVPVPAIFPGWSGDPTTFLPDRVVLPWEWSSPALFGVLGVDPQRWIGLLMEALQTVPQPRIADGEAPAGSLRRVVAESYLVEDVDRALETLRETMNLEPGPDELDVRSFRTFKRARLVPGDPGDGSPVGAALELIEPTSDEGRAGRHFQAYGPGLYATRLGTASLSACTDELGRRGTRWSAVDEETGEERIQVDPLQVCGALIEIEAG
jgi:hypothetical protein